MKNTAPYRFVVHFEYPAIRGTHRGLSVSHTYGHVAHHRYLATLAKMGPSLCGDGMWWTSSHHGQAWALSTPYVIGTRLSLLYCKCTCSIIWTFVHY